MFTLLFYCFPHPFFRKELETQQKRYKLVFDKENIIMKSKRKVQNLI